MKEKHLLSLKDFTAPEIEEIFDLAARMKADPAAYSRTLEGKSLAMIFQKPSTRTRVSFEVGMFQLGGQALFLGSDQIQILRGESIDDTAKVLSGYVDGILARVHSHEDLLNLAKHGTVPVINGLSDLVHPVQAIADFFTLRELKGDLGKTRLAYLGDGNNMCHALLLGAAKLGVSIQVATPPGYEPNPLMVKSAIRDAQKSRTPLPTLTQDPRSAVAGADCVYTDVWTSMGQEAETQARKAAFQGFCVSPELMSLARPDAVFMHCLPAHRGEEVAAEVIDGPQSVVFLQSQNRLHVQKAILALLLGGRLP